MTPATLSFPQILPVDPSRIPELVKRSQRWFPWQAGPFKPNGKFDKVPVDPRTGRMMNPLDPSNWWPFDEALHASQSGIGHGVGIALSDSHPITIDKVPYFITAVDLDDCGHRRVEVEALWRHLGEPYVEASPSGNGVRMLGLSRALVKSGNAGGGRELYASKRFVTVTGHRGRGTVHDFTAGIVALERQWFGARNTAKPSNDKPVQRPAHPETVEAVGRVISMLDAVSSDTSYEVWRDIIWSLASTHWESARRLAHQWSARAGPRYDATELDKLFDSFDPSRGITLGTLRHHAGQKGWIDKHHALLQVPPVSGEGLSSPSLMTAEQLRQIPSVPYVVRGVFPARGLAAIYGEPGSGKSFLALHLAHTIATGGTDWFGFRIRQKPVVYAVLEGAGGMCKRMTALEAHSQQSSSDHLRFWCHELHLLTGDGIDQLASLIVETVGHGAVVIIDTLNQASPGADENASQDMGKIIANAKRLAEAVDGLTILVHHSGKNRAQGLRGHSSLHAAMDAVLEVATVDGKHKTWAITKAKDDSSDVKRDFDLASYTVGSDEDGEPITSCAVQHAVHAAHVKRKAPTGKHQKTALQQLRQHLLQPGQTIDHKSALALVATALDVPEGKKGERANGAVDALLRDRHLTMNEGDISLA